MEKLGPLPTGVPEYYRKIIPALYRTGFLGWRVPIKWAILTWRGFFTATPRGPLGHKAVEEVAVKSAALACENLMLAFRAFGFDTLPMEGFDECRVRKALALPWDAKVVMVIGAGKRSPHGIYGPRIRLPLKNFLFER
jgi:nitroreductase